MTPRPAPDFAPLRQRFLDRLGVRLVAIYVCLNALQHEPCDRLVSALMLEFHSLTGTSGTLGYHSISAVAAGAERTCGAMLLLERYDNPSDHSRLKFLVQEIEKQLVEAA